MFLTVFLVGGAAFAVRRMGGSVGAQGAIVGIGLIFVMLAQLALPDGNPLRVATCGSVWSWVTLLGIGVVIFSYFWLRDNARDPISFDSQSHQRELFTAMVPAEITPDQIAEMSKEIAEVKSQIVEKEEEWFMLSEG